MLIVKHDCFILIFITCAKAVMFSLCLLVCLLAGLRGTHISHCWWQEVHPAKIASKRVYLGSHIRALEQGSHRR